MENKKNTVYLNNKNKFFDENKKYTLKESILNKTEKNFYNTIKQSLKINYIIQPQTNLQTIIETNLNKRNEELYRNIDFIIFNANEYTPILGIELNGKQHYINEYWIERDKSIKKILEQINIPLLTLKIEDLQQMGDEDIQYIIAKTINYIELKNLISLDEQKDLTWINELVETIKKINQSLK